MAYQLKQENNGFLLVHTGTVSIEEINEVNGLIHGHPDFDTHRYQIVDLLAADFSEILTSTAKQPGATDWAASKTVSRVKVAILVEEPDAREFCQEYVSTAQQMGSDWEFALFPCRDEARQWIGPLAF